MTEVSSLDASFIRLNDVKRKYEDDAMENLDDLSGLNFLR